MNGTIGGEKSIITGRYINCRFRLTRASLLERNE